jgi:integrase
MRDAGIGQQQVKGKGKQGRMFSKLSFHSLRHTFTSALANANVPAEVRQKLTGHGDAAMHQRYTHLELQPLQAAIATLPSVFKGQALVASAVRISGGDNQRDGWCGISNSRQHRP